MTNPMFTKDQAAAWEKIKTWAASSSPFFSLKGPAGTGKTFLMQELKTLPHDFFYSAPTNKATKVLSNAVGQSAKTTYSALGLTMKTEDDTLVLSRVDRPPYYPRGSILVVDEAGCIGTPLCDALKDTVNTQGIKVLLVGDPYQLNPVNEIKSPAWALVTNADHKAVLREVKRFDNELLALSIKLRDCIKERDWSSPVVSNHSETTGVWKYKTSQLFQKKLLEQFSTKDPSVSDDTKVIAWRNKTVNYYNDLIRSALRFSNVFEIGERVLLAQPVIVDGKIKHHVDDDFEVTAVVDTLIRSEGFEIPAWRLETPTALFSVPKDSNQLASALASLADAAKTAPPKDRRTTWARFWTFKNLFNSVRYGYALTAHRAQGSTFKNVWVDQMDILSNSSNKEAFRCLYVAATRPTTQFHTF